MAKIDTATNPNGVTPCPGFTASHGGDSPTSVGTLRRLVVATAVCLSFACSSGSRVTSMRDKSPSGADTIRGETVALKFSGGSSAAQDAGLNLASQRKAVALLEVGYTYFNPPNAMTGVTGKLLVGYDLTATSGTQVPASLLLPLGAKVSFTSIGVLKFRVDPITNEPFIQKSRAEVADAAGKLNLVGIAAGRSYTYGITVTKPADIAEVRVDTPTVNVAFSFTESVKDCLNDAANSQTPECENGDTEVPVNPKLVVVSGQSVDAGVNPPLVAFLKDKTGLATGAVFVAGTSPVSNRAMTVTKVTLRFSCRGDTCPTRLAADFTNQPHLTVNGSDLPSPRISQNLTTPVMRLLNGAGQIVTDLPQGTASYTVEIDAGNMAVAQSQDVRWKNDLTFTLERVEGNKVAKSTFSLANIIVKNY